MPTLSSLGAADLRQALLRFRDAVRAHQEELNRLNVYPVPDGDTGTNMALTLESVGHELRHAESMAEVCQAISRGSLMGARGNSGRDPEPDPPGPRRHLQGARRGPEPAAACTAFAAPPTPRTRRSCARSKARSSPWPGRSPRPPRRSTEPSLVALLDSRGDRRPRRGRPHPGAAAGAARGRRRRRGRQGPDAAHRRVARGRRRTSDPRARARRDAGPGRAASRGRRRRRRCATR